MARSCKILMLMYRYDSILEISETCGIAKIMKYMHAHKNHGQFSSMNLNYYKTKIEVTTNIFRRS